MKAFVLVFFFLLISYSSCLFQPRTNIMLASIGGCPCEDQSLCVPKQTKKANHQTETVIISDKNHQEATIISTEKPSYELICELHSLGKKGLLRTFLTENELNSDNSTSLISLIKSLIKTKEEYFFDGIHIDTNKQTFQTPFLAQKFLLVAQILSHELKQGGNQEIFMMTVPWSPFEFSVQTAALQSAFENLNYILIDSSITLTRYFERCEATALSPIQKIKEGIIQYKSLSIRTKKMIVSFKRHAIDFECSNENERFCGTEVDKDGFCDLSKLKIVTNSEVEELKKIASSKLFVDRLTNNTYFDYKSPSDSSSHQVWFESEENWNTKINSVKQLDIAGVSFTN